MAEAGVVGRELGSTPGVWLMSWDDKAHAEKGNVTKHMQNEATSRLQ
jgi:hypothetical protein